MYAFLLILLASAGNAALIPETMKPALTQDTQIQYTNDHIRDQDAQHFVQLDAVYHGRNLRGSSLYSIEAETSLSRNSEPYSADIDMIGSEGLIAYVTEVTLGSNDTFKMVIDTGSSDTWVVRKRFDCLDLDMVPQVTEFCKLGRGYQSSPTFRDMNDLHFATKYGDGERLFGSVGTENIKVGTLTVPNQRINLVDRAAWRGDGQTSGLLGLGFPAITSNYRGTNQTDNSSPVTYDPFFTTALKANLVPSGSFSIALQRNPNTTAQGYLSFGGLPPVKTYGKSVSVPFSPRIRSSLGQTDYVIQITGFGFPMSTSLKSNLPLDALIDSGTSLLLVPEPVARAYNALWDPNHQEAPPFSILINGTEFPLDPKDLRFPTQTGFASAVFVGQRTILGGTFMRNVVSTFDVGGGQMRFASTNSQGGPEQRTLQA